MLFDCRDLATLCLSRFVSWESERNTGGQHGSQRMLSYDGNLEEEIIDAAVFSVDDGKHVNMEENKTYCLISSVEVEARSCSASYAFQGEKSPWPSATVLFILHVYHHILRITDFLWLRSTFPGAA